VCYISVDYAEKGLSTALLLFKYILICFHDVMRRIARAEKLGGYKGRKVWEVRKVKRCGRLGRSEILGGYGL
jgi:hypothetical protein